MPTPSINVILQAILAVTNPNAPNAPQIINVDFGNPAIPAVGFSGGNAVYFDPSFQAPTTGATIVLPQPTCYFMCIQNLTTGSGSLLAVNYTTGLGGGTVEQTLGPNGLMIIYDTAEAGNGIVGLTLTGVGIAVPTLVLIGA